MLETLRKCTTKILTNRLTQVFTRKKILKGPNFAGLLGNSTEEPVHIINALMEDAKDNNKELWLVFQDMKKAFDSVSLQALDLTMKRLRMSKRTINFILNLFENRQSKVIIHWETTETWKVEDGIEQGKVLLLLV